jgi:hypothetical protein
MLFDLIIHAVPWQCMIALSLGIPGYLWSFACHFTVPLSVILLNVVLLNVTAPLNLIVPKFERLWLLL